MSLIAAILSIFFGLIACNRSCKAGKLRGRGYGRNDPAVEDLSISAGGFLLASFILTLVAAWL